MVVGILLQRLIPLATRAVPAVSKFFFGTARRAFTTITGAGVLVASPTARKVVAKTPGFLFEKGQVLGQVIEQRKAKITKEQAIRLITPQAQQGILFEAVLEQQKRARARTPVGKAEAILAPGLTAGERIKRGLIGAGVAGAVVAGGIAAVKAIKKRKGKAIDPTVNQLIPALTGQMPGVANGLTTLPQTAAAPTTRRRKVVKQAPSIKVSVPVRNQLLVINNGERVELFE